MCDADLNPPSAYHAAIQRARELRICSECWRPIAVRERYRNVIGKWDGDQERFRICAHCHAAGEIITAIFGVDLCWGHTEQWDAVRDQTSRGYGQPVIARLIKRAERKWVGRRGRLLLVPKMVTAGPSEQEAK